MEKQPLADAAYTSKEPPPDYDDGSGPPPGGYQAITKEPPGGVASVHHVTLYEGEAPQEPYPSMWCPLLLSCWVFWCISPIFGAAAFFVGCLAKGSYSSQDAHRLRRTSIWLSVVGMIISLIICLVLVILHFTIGLFAAD